MNHFDYRDGVLHAEAVNPSHLAEAVGTPFYCYATATLERHYRVFADFAGVMVNTTVVCNGQVAGSHKGGYLPFSGKPGPGTRSPFASSRA